MKLIEVQMTITVNSIDGKYPNVQSRDPSNNLAQFTVSILFTDTHMLAYHLQPLTPSAILFNPTS